MTIDMSGFRKPDYPVNPIFVERWSPRAMSGEALSEADLMSLFEAARWAPSSYNNQPWRFIYARRDSQYWDRFFDLLVAANKEWAHRAAALVVIISKQTFDHNNKPARTHSFDAGAAWMSLALEGSSRGLVVHGMQGFDYDKARAALNVPDDYEIEAMAAIGRPGRVDDLPEKLREREKPSGRKPLAQIAMEGRFTT